MNKDDLQAAIDLEIADGEKQYGFDFKIRIIKILSLERMLHPDCAEKKSRIIPLTKWNDYHPYPSVGTLYQYKFNGERNGFNSCIERGGVKGNRILINEDKFWEWHKNRNANSKLINTKGKV